MGGSARVETAMLWGMEARPVTVEVSLSAGFPGITIVGRPDPAVAESRSRVRCAMRSAGFKVPRDSVTVNLSPAELHKSGTAFDLPIAVGILAATGQIPSSGLEGCIVVGELSLTGDVLPVRGLMAYARLAARSGRALVSPPGPIAAGAGEVSGRFVDHIAQLKVPIVQAGTPVVAIGPPQAPASWEDDLSCVAGQSFAKRAMVVAAAGGHGMLMVGPPGVGKTLLARCMPTIMSPLADLEFYEAMLVHSLAGVRDARVESGLRPFRAPHHSASTAGLVGGGRPVRPGEVSLAHRGVLFLDEMAEFSARTLQALRQPIEEGVVRITRTEGTYEFPCDFQLVAASNPCPCGHLGDPLVECTCSETAVRSYQARLTGPLMDRVDIVVRLERPTAGEIMGDAKTLTSSEARGAVAAAREIARERRLGQEGQAGEGGAPGIVSAMGRALFDDRARRLVEELVARRGMSVRAVASMVRVARTVADVDQCERVEEGHVYEALGYRDARMGA